MIFKIHITGGMFNNSLDEELELVENIRKAKTL
jgi:hypothetical protein